MKIIQDDVVDVMQHVREMKLEDGPVVDAGATYKAGTLIRVESVRVRWEDDGLREARIRVRGHRVNKDGGISAVPHELLLFPSTAPDWLREILGWDETAFE